MSEEEKMRLWAAAWMAVAASSNCSDKDAPAKWADRFLRDLNERLGK